MLNGEKSDYLQNCKSTFRVVLPFNLYVLATFRANAFSTLMIFWFNEFGYA